MPFFTNFSNSKNFISVLTFLGGKILQKFPNIGLVSYKKYIVFLLHKGGGGVRRNVTFFFEDVPKLDIISNKTECTHFLMIK